MKDDMTLEMEIIDVLNWDATLEPGKIKPSVKSGNVTLTGTVSTEAEKRRAKDLVTEVVGVRGIVNRVTVQAESSAS